MNIQYVLEQPQSSLLFVYPPINEILSNTAAMQVSFAMRDFNGESHKQLILQGNGGFLKQFEGLVQLRKAKRTKRVLTPLTSQSGKSFTDHSDALKKSSGYTRSMSVGMALAIAGLSASWIDAEMSRLAL